LHPALRSLALCALAFAAFLTVSRTLSPHVPWPAGFEIREKLAVFEAQKDEIDVLFLGSSTVYRSFRPRVIDAEWRELGLDLRSFNLGFGGMSAFEADQLLREVLAMEPARLRWVFVEPRVFHGRLAESPNAFTERSVRWHTWSATLQALHSVDVSDVSDSERRAEWDVHWRLFARKLGNYGLGPSLVSPWFGPEPDAELMDDLERERGYRPLEAVGDAVAARRALLVQHPERYWQRVTQLQAGNRAAVKLGTLNRSVISEQRWAVHRAGATHLAVVPPGLAPTAAANALHAAGILPDLFAFNRPTLYPGFYELDARFDQNHLSRSGAEAFSRIFARQVAERLRGR